MRTYSHAEWQASLDAWEGGEFSSEWRALRHTMAMQGCIYPPAGTQFDSWEDAQPSQRAVLIRAIRETPELLRRCAKGARSWSQVIERLFMARDEWRTEMRPVWEREEAEERPHRRWYRVGDVLAPINDSLGIDA